MPGLALIKEEYVNRIFLALAAMVAAVSSYAAEEWIIDSSHGAARFKVRHMMVSNVEGTISNIKGTFTYDDKDVTKTKTEATLDATTINTSNTDRDTHLKTPDFLDTAKFPTVTFKSKSAKKGGKGKFQLLGALTLHGVTKDITLDVEDVTEVVKDAKGNTRRGFLATTKINRQDFGVNFNKKLDNGGLVLGDVLDVTVEFELVPPKKEEKKT